MDNVTAISKFFDAIKDDDERSAKALCKDVKQELSILKASRDLHPSAIPVIDEVAQLEENVSRGRINIARGKNGKIRARFNGHLKQKLEAKLAETGLVKQLPEAKTRSERNKVTQNPRDQYQNVNYANQKHPYLQHESSPALNKESYGKDQSLHDKSERSSKEKGINDDVMRSSYPCSGSDTKPVEMRYKPSNHEIGDESTLQKSKRASHAMRHNNPDIADLSDTNRPTKNAEKFAELYDNEWTEAFEALCKTKSRHLPESETISILLRIVQQAYRFCTEEAENMISKLENDVKPIITGEDNSHALQSQTDDQNAGERSRLVELRKDIAARAIDRLSNDFYDQHLRKVFVNIDLEEPKPDGPTAKYASRAVEICLWMCVQSPPVYMCPTEHGEFDPRLYRAYTKSGTIPDFIVWPALKLHKDGGVLSKGVVQYK